MYARQPMAASKIRDYERVQPPDRAAWRAWLAQNHAASPGIWLVLVKKGGQGPRLLLDEAVEEALCFGWIDSLPNKLDAERYLLLVTPRKPGSVWSKINKERVQRLMEQGLITEAGLAKIEAAKADGSWSALDAIDALEMPPDLERALAANRTAKKNFDGFSQSARKGLLYWITSAKRAETREKRIAETVAKAADNRVANQYVRKGS